MSSVQARSRLFGPKLGLARAVGALSRRSGRGGGTTAPGRLLLRLAPDGIRRLSSKLESGSTVISATNGKTTTAGMLASILRAAGREPVHNRAGSNMHWGVATALLSQRGSEGLFEVDEAWLPEVTDALDARLVVLGNLFRDQLDRYGELEHVASEWDRLVRSRAGRTRFILNADDPLVAELGRGDDGRLPEGATCFGIDDPSVALPELQHAHDAKVSRRTGEAFRYEHAFVGHLGVYSLPGDAGARPPRDVSARAVRLQGMSGSEVDVETPAGPATFRLPLPGLYNVYNALGALAAGLQLGVPLEIAVRGLEAMSAVFGRVERIAIGESELAILLVKNPTGANEVLRTLMLETDSGVDLWIALNDEIADGRDVSWVWDADFELLADRARTVTCAGTRAPEMAVRLKYAGWPVDAIEVVEGIPDSLDRAIERCGGRLFALPTYTALLELRTLLTDRGLAPDYWE